MGNTAQSICNLKRWAILWSGRVPIEMSYAPIEMSYAPPSITRMSAHFTISLIPPILALVLAVAPCSEAAAQSPRLHGVAVARDGGPIVAWSANELFVGDHEGASFRALPITDVHDVAVEPGGAMLVLRVVEDSPVSVHFVLDLVRRDGSVHRVENRHVRLVAAGPRTLAYLGPSGVLRSDDGGANFAPVALPSPCLDCEGGVGAEADLGVTAEGTLVLTDTEVSTCSSVERLLWQRVMRAQRGEGFTQSFISIPLWDSTALWFVGAFGWVYGSSVRGRLFAASGSRAWLLEQPQHDFSDVIVKTNGRITIVFDGNQLIEVVGRRMRVIDSDAPEISSLAVDSRGRPLAIIQGALARFRRGRGWETLFP